MKPHLNQTRCRNRTFETRAKLLWKPCCADVKINRSKAPSPLSEKRRIHVRTVNVGVAAGARHAIRRSLPLTMNRAGSYRAMALVAEHVNIRHVQHPSVLRTVRRMACQAAFRFDRRVLVDKGPTHICVAFGADHALICRGPQVAVLEGAVNVMAVTALDGAFVYRVVEGHIELSFLIAVTLEAERGLRSLEQSLILAAVNAVAAGAADVGLGMRRAVEVGMRAGVAAKKHGVDK